MQRAASRGTYSSCGELVSQLNNPENSLFYKSTFGDESDESYSDGRGSSSALIESQNEGVEEGSVLVFAEPPETDGVQDTPSENAFRELIANALEAMAEQPGKRAVVDEVDVAHSVKRSRAAR